MPLFTQIYNFIISAPKFSSLAHACLHLVILEY